MPDMISKEGMRIAMRTTRATVRMRKRHLNSSERVGRRAKALGETLAARGSMPARTSRVETIGEQLRGERWLADVCEMGGDD